MISAVAGSLCVVAGAAMIYRPLGLLAIGGLMLGLAVSTARNKRAR